MLGHDPRGERVVGQHAGVTGRVIVVGLGAALIAVGDFITGLVSVGGSEVAAAMLVICRDSAWEIGRAHV